MITDADFTATVSFLKKKEKKEKKTVTIIRLSPLRSGGVFGRIL